MTAKTFEEACDAVAARITAANIPGLLAVYDRPQDSFNSPCAMVGPGEGDFIAYDPAMSSDAADFRIAVSLFAEAADILVAQQLLLPFLRQTGSTSIRAALLAPPPTDGLSIAVEKATRMQPILFGDGNVRYLTCDIILRVLA